jgi:PhzF family phenazine biosynthesis protein
MLRRFQQVDVFSATPYRGNPLAVVVDGEGLGVEDRQGFAQWTNLSETTFVVSPTHPDADYRLHIHTPTVELPFAGHPTLGSCHAWLAAGGRPARPDRVVQECGAGLITIRRDGDRLAFSAPPLVRSGPVGAALAQQLPELLGLAPGEVLAAEWVDNGPGWLGVLVPDADTVLRVRADVGELYVGVVGPYPPDAPCAFEVRAFFPKDGSSAEDPVTGSLNASLAQWLLGSGRASAPYVARQGTALGRAGEVHVAQDPDGTIWVSGRTVTCITGEVEL